MESPWDLVWYFFRLSRANKQTTNKQIKQGVGIKEVFHCKMKKKSVLNFVLFPKFRYDLEEINIINCAYTRF